MNYDNYDERVKWQQIERKAMMLAESKANLNDWFNERKAEDKLYVAPETLEGRPTRKHGNEHTRIKSEHVQPKRDAAKSTEVKSDGKIRFKVIGDEVVRLDKSEPVYRPFKDDGGGRVFRTSYN